MKVISSAKRFFACCLMLPAIAVAVFLSFGAVAEERIPDDAKKGQSGTGSPSELDRLFDELRMAHNPVHIQTVEMAIGNVWRHTESPTVGLLMMRARQALRERDYDRSLSHLSWVVALYPDYVEGWFERAMLYRKRDREREAVADLLQVVAREPRHFPALMLLGEIFLEVGHDKAALEAYRLALEANPHLDEARRIVKYLEPQVEGRAI